ncbi:MAG: aspartate aminotransferase family protein [Bacteroidetes bacterium]|nr:aspartate aminotransferase family protein [Bacteroidota bacterium]MBL0064170.1 aspartate aminotransferase family protein [Bacteroidota bacterium]MBL0139448.1 aspartate aminotransferase family protein [Bacteroidota bacterium]
MSTDRQLFYQYVAQTSPLPMGLMIDKAEGVYLYDTSGKAYLDLISGIAVSNLGHQHPLVLGAIREQLDKHMHVMVYGEFIQSPQVKLATLLASLLPRELDNIYFTNSGTEAVEGALKLAKRYTGRSHFISFRNAYHGSSQGALSVCGNEMLKNAFRPLLPGGLISDFNDFSVLNSIDSNCAGVIVEAIQAEAGIVLPESGFLEALQRKCNEVGALLILDEIQTGMGRTGKLFAMEHTGIIPDILLLGKSFGGGLPLAAFISNRQIMESLTHDPVLGHISTFGGHPLSCAAAYAALSEISKPELNEKVNKQGDLFKSLLKHPDIRSVRGLGLFLALEFESEMINQAVIKKCLEKGIITDWFLFAPNCLRIAPPLIITDDQIKFACASLVEAINTL